MFADVSGKLEGEESVEKSIPDKAKPFLWHRMVHIERPPPVGSKGSPDKLKPIVKNKARQATDDWRDPIRNLLKESLPRTHLRIGAK